MSHTVELACSCGTVKGNISIVPKSFFHVKCLCCDCQNFASYLQNEEKILDKHGGTELFQTYPDLMKITAGHENISAVQFKKKGLYRWHTTCCNMPLANTMNSSSIPFVGVSVKFMKFSTGQESNNAIGPITLRAFGKYAKGEMPKNAHPKFPLSYMPKILSFMIKGLIKKRHQPSPFFQGKEPFKSIKLLY